LTVALALVVAPGHDPELVDANLAFHLGTGIGLILAADRGASDETREVLHRYERQGLIRLAASGERDEDSTRRALTRLAGEQGAAWVIPSAANEFWWPRGESLDDVFAAIPARYSIVQALVRKLVASAADEGLEGRLTLRRVLPPEGTGDPPSAHLRPMLRAAPDPGPRSERDRVPLRAWYPVELFVVPAASASQLAPQEVERGRAEGTLVEDTRLRDALVSLRGPNGYTRTAMRLRSPSVVDDAAYAVECAAVGEVDLDALDRHIRELEARIAFLEQRLWPRVLRAASRVTRRVRG
jgi:hypothetical protein